MTYMNDKFNNTNESTTTLRQARGGNLYNRVSSTEAMELIQRKNAPIIGFIERKLEGKLPKAICCEIDGANCMWLFALAVEAENCQEGVPYLFTVEAVRYNRDDTPYVMVKPVILLSPELMQNERFGNLIAKSGRFPMYWCLPDSREWNYAPLCEHFNLPVDTDEITLCKHAVDQALAGNISFEEIVEFIHLPKNLAGSFGGADAVTPGTFRPQNISASGKNKPKRKRTCKGKKYKEPRQKPASTPNASNNGKGGKNGKNKDNGTKKKGK